MIVVTKLPMFQNQFKIARWQTRLFVCLFFIGLASETIGASPCLAPMRDIVGLTNKREQMRALARTLGLKYITSYPPGFSRIVEVESGSTRNGTKNKFKITYTDSQG